MEKNKFISIAVLLTGLFFCFYGVRFQLFSQYLILIFIFSIFIDENKKQLKSIIDPVQEFFQTTLPDSLVDNSYTIALLAGSFILVLLLGYFLHLTQLLSLYFIFCIIYILIEPVFVYHKIALPAIMALIFSFLCVFVIYKFFSKLKSRIIALLICFIGTSMVLLFVANSLSSFSEYKEFYIELMRFDSHIFSSYQLYLTMLLTIIFYIIQTAQSK